MPKVAQLAIDRTVFKLGSLTPGPDCLTILAILLSVTLNQSVITALPCRSGASQRAWPSQSAGRGSHHVNSESPRMLFMQMSRRRRQVRAGLQGDLSRFCFCHLGPRPATLLL